VIPEELRRE